MIRKTVGTRCHVLRRKDVKLDSPKIYEERSLELPRKYRKVYKEAEDLFILEDTSGRELERTTHSVVQYQWMRQLCGGFLEGKLVWDGKIKEVLALLDGELRSQSVVIWFDYNQEVRATKQALRKKGFTVAAITGATKRVRDRKVITDRFQQQKFQVLLLQQRVAQMGLDLSAADTAIYYSNPLAMLARMQTEDRIVQVVKKENRPLLYLDLVVRDSVDHDVYRALREKRFKSTLTISRARRYCKERRDHE